MAPRGEEVLERLLLKEAFPDLGPYGLGARGTVEAWVEAGWTPETFGAVVWLADWGAEHGGWLATHYDRTRLLCSLVCMWEIFDGRGERHGGGYWACPPGEVLPADRVVPWLALIAGAATEAAVSELDDLIEAEWDEDRMAFAAWWGLGLMGALAYAAGLSPNDVTDRQQACPFDPVALRDLAAARGWCFPAGLVTRRPSERVGA
jgi:hypothetical protein